MSTKEERKPVAKYGVLLGDRDVDSDSDKKLFQAALKYIGATDDPDVSIEYEPFGNFIKAEIFVYNQEKVAAIQAELFAGHTMAPWRNRASGLREMKI